MTVDEPSDALAALVERRSNRLARALLALGISTNDRAAIACCDEHEIDRDVAFLAVSKTGAAPASVDDGPVRVVLACAEGLDAWRRTGQRAIVIADAPDVLWWKALELNYSPTPVDCDIADPAPPCV